MNRNKGSQPAVRVYTVCDESKYLVVKNVPALGCGDDLMKLFASYGDIEEFKPMDSEDCEPFTDVFFIKFVNVSSARFAKRKLDEFVFFGNRLQVFYQPLFESLLDTKDKLETRRREVSIRLNHVSESKSSACSSSIKSDLQQQKRLQPIKHPNNQNNNALLVSSSQDYFPSESMNRTVRLVRQKLEQVESTESRPKRSGSNNRIRI